MTNRGRTFPRGLVLGLTMAEIAILIIFVLLLVLAAMLARESDRREHAESELERYEDVREIFEEEELPQDPTVLRAVLVERAERHQAADNWRVLVRELERTDSGPSAQQLVERIQRSEIGMMSPAEAEQLLAARRAVERADAHAELEQALQEAGVSPSAGEIRDMAAAMRAADARGMTPAEIQDAVENHVVWNEAVDDTGRLPEPEELRNLVDAVRAAAEQGLSPEQVADAVEAHRELAEVLGREGAEATDDAVREAIRDARRWRQMGGESLQERLEQVLDERDREREKAERLQSRIRALGSGTDHPSCWYQADGITTAYLFDVALTRRGLVVDYAATSSRHVLIASGERLLTVEEARAAVPAGGVPRRELVSPTEFLRQTRAVHDRSRDSDPECRFFVRVFDRTAARQKQLYKDLLQVVEQHFYKLLMEDAGLPPGLKRALER